MKDQYSSAGAGSPRAVSALAQELGLTEPALPALSCGCANERQLFSWLSAYELQPYAVNDQKRLAAMLLALIEEVGQWTAPTSTRLPMLDLLREYAIACVDAMALQRMALATTQTEQLRAAVGEALRLQLALGDAYAAIFLQLARVSGVVMFVGRRRARALQRALDSYRRVLRINALFGLALPEGCWRKVHSLLRFGMTQQVATKRTADPLHSRGKDSAMEAYLHAALFANVEPAQLSGEEQESLWGLTEGWSRQTSVEPSYVNAGDALLASSALDQAPLPARRLEGTDFNPGLFCAPSGWKVDLSALLEKLEKTRGPKPLVMHVLKSLGSAAGRTDERKPWRLECEVCIGLAATAFHLGSEGRVARLRSAGARSSAHAHSYQREKRLCLEVGAVDFASGRAVDEYDVALPSAPRPRSESLSRAGRAAQHYFTERGQVLNRSAEGLGIRLPLNISQRLKVGELLGVQLQEGWKVAVIRWRCIQRDHCQVGVQVLSDRALPVQVRRHNVSGRSSEPIPALQLPAEGEGPDTLLLPVPLFKCFDNIELQVAGMNRSVVLQKQPMTAANFARFEYV